MAKMCVLEDGKICNSCGECDYCDLNPFEKCTNCGRCIEGKEEYRELKIDDIIIPGKKRRTNKEPLE